MKLSCKRFEALYTCSHLVDESVIIPRSQPGHDILYKIRPLIESLNTAFRDIYYPTCELSVDERMAKSGYTLNFSVYCGK